MTKYATKIRYLATKSRRIQQEMIHKVIGGGEMRDTYQILARKHQGKRPLGKPKIILK